MQSRWAEVQSVSLPTIPGLHNRQRLTTLCICHCGDISEVGTTAPQSPFQGFSRSWHLSEAGRWGEIFPLARRGTQLTKMGLEP